MKNKNSEPSKWEKWVQNGAILSMGNNTLQLSQGPFKPSPSMVPASPTLQWKFADFFQVNSPWMEGASNTVVGFETLKEKLLNVGSLPSDLEWQEPDKSLFAHRFNHIQSKLRQGSLKKVVPVVFASSHWEIDDKTLLAMINNLMNSPGHGYVFGYWNLQKREGILGRTPELLFQLSGNQLKTMALAGTAKSPEHQLIEDKKERWEHDLVVTSLTRSLTPLGDVSVEGPYEWSTGTLTHLRTDLEVKNMREAVSTEELLQTLHPTPALGGEPRQQALQLLQSWDTPTPRGPFGAPFGFYSSSGISMFVVGIRCLIWKQGVVYCGSGCGVVDSSDLESEWQELSRKRNSVKTMFGLQ